MPAGNTPALHLATDGFLSCPLSVATTGYLYCPSRGGGDSSKGGFKNFDVHMYRLKQEDDDILSVILASIEYLQ